MHHKTIHRFEQSGQCSDKYFQRTQVDQINILVLTMRYRGYLPRFDIEPDWTVDYNGKDYDFRLSIYGVYVGKRKAMEWQGIIGNKTVGYIQNNKSGAHSQPQG